jgi:steroid 5-alpha reductase family enzyme
MRLQKLSISIFMILTIVLAYWILFEGRLVSDFSAAGSKIFLFIAIVIYQARFLITINLFKSKTPLFQLVQNKKFPYVLDFICCFGAFILFPLIMASFGRYYNNSLEIVDFIFLILFLVGTMLAFISELQRFFWKKKPENQGKLYTEGLLKYSMHMNYFGETLVIPSYFYLAFGSILLSSVLILLQVLDFLLVQIPPQDKYLKEKYGDSFNSYASRTKKLIPFIY